MKSFKPFLRDAQRWLPVAAMGSVAVADLGIAGVDMGGFPVYAAGPALAAASGTVRRVLFTGLLGAALCLATAAVEGLFGHTRIYVALAAILYVTLAACYVSARRRRAEHDLLDARAVADTVQHVLLAEPPGRIGPLNLAASYVSAARAARIGGDLYEVVAVPGGVRLIVADVQGKGLEAVRGASVALAAFREAAPYAERLEPVAERIELALARRTDGERFVTAVLAEIRDDGVVTLLNCGHPAPILVRADGGLELAEPAVPAPPLGLSDLAQGVPTPLRLTLEPGERILFHTDGLTEARDRSGGFYPALARAGAPLADPVPGRALSRLRADVGRHTGADAQDDSALLLVEYAPERAARTGARHPVRDEAYAAAGRAA
ncbi:PP2C family protein-serine/threonine phosphatase [Kitasatospora sp. NPDC057015]|uniref:PP2C family protein-serine/threonine phosphatase n=1 Tax=Kitasatospora sp. NPDC057015 TaxID=3346001 RepID=UPI00362A6C6A